MEGRIALPLAVPLPVPFRRRRIQTVELFGIDVAGPVILPGTAQGRPRVKVLSRCPPQKKRLFLKIGIPARALEKFLHRMLGRFQADHLKLVKKRIHLGFLLLLSGPRKGRGLLQHKVRKAALAVPDRHAIPLHPLHQGVLGRNGPVAFPQHGHVDGTVPRPDDAG